MASTKRTSGSAAGCERFRGVPSRVCKRTVPSLTREQKSPLSTSSSDEKLKDDFTRPGSGRSTIRESRAEKRDLPAELYTSKKPKVLAKSMILDGVRFDWPDYGSTKRH